LISAAVIFSAGCATQQGPEATAPQGAADAMINIHLDKPLFFQTPDGQTVRTPSGDYRVEDAADAQLRLLSLEHAPTLIVVATPNSHDLDLSATFVLTFTEKEDEQHILLLHPDGSARDAVGSLSGIQSRDVFRAKRLYTLQSETGTVRFGDGIVGQAPPTAASTIVPSYRAGAGTAGNTGKDSALSMFELQSLLSDRQRALALSQAVLAAQNEHFHLEYNTDRPGSDYAQRLVANPESCRAACTAEGTCQAFTFVKPAVGAPVGQCFLKQTVPAYVSNPCCISAQRKSAQEELIGNVGKK